MMILIPFIIQDIIFSRLGLVYLLWLIRTMSVSPPIRYNQQNLIMKYHHIVAVVCRQHVRILKLNDTLYYCDFLNEYGF